MKKFKIAFIVISMCVFLISSICFASTENVSATLAKQFNVIYDNKNIELKNSNDEIIYPILYDGSTFLPIDVFASIANASFEWNKELKSVCISSSGDTQENKLEERTEIFNENQSIEVIIDDEIKFFYDGELQNLTSINGILREPIIYNDTIYLPLRTLAELFDFEVEWYSDTWTVVLSKQSNTSSEIYSDIAGTPYESAIKALTELEIVNGYPNGTFRPNVGMTRAEYTVYLVRSCGLESDANNAQNETSIYTDVEEANHWAKGYINIANEYGFIMGYDDGIFKPENAITCREAIIYAVRALGYKYTLEEAHITKAESLKITNNLVINSYSDKLTRGNACILLWNMLRIPMWDINGEDYNIKLQVPIFKREKDKVVEYNGEEQTIELRNFDDDLMIITNNKQKEVGKYKINISLKYPNEYVWKIYDETTSEYIYTSGDQEIEWEIIKAKLYPPLQAQGRGRKYTGEMIKAQLFYFDESIMTISGDEAIAVGKYTATVSLKDKEHYEWMIYNKETEQFEDYTTSEDQKIEWVIEKGFWDASVSNLTQIEDSINAPTYVLQPLVTNGTVEVYYSQVAHAQESDGDGLSVGWKGVIYDDKLPWENEELKENGIAYPWFAWGENLEVTGTIDLQFEKDKIPTKAGSYVYAIVVSGDDNIANGCYLDELRIREKNNSNNNNNNTQSGNGSTSNNGGGGGSSSTTITYKATITQTKGGTITVDKTEVEKGKKQVFTIVADTGYKIVDVKVDGKSVGAVNTYTIEKVTKKHKITATFEKLTEEEIKELEESKETTWVNTFEDVTTNDWYYEAVKFVNEAGLFKGLSDTEFGANVTMNRAMIVTVLHRLAGETEASNNNINFNDISNEEYYTNAVIWAVENGIVNGVGNNEFAPQNNVTREQLIVMLYRYTKLNGNLTEEQANLSSYDDVNLISDYAEEAFAWAIQKGIITGRTTTTLAPQGIATRAEVATMIMRFSNMINEA